MISNMLKPKTIIEIGTYTGYSIMFGQKDFTENGILHTIDINEEYTSYAHKYFQRSNYTDKITQHIGKYSRYNPLYYRESTISIY